MVTLGAARLSRLVGAEASAQLTRCAPASVLSSRTTSEQRAETGGGKAADNEVPSVQVAFVCVGFCDSAQ